MKGGVKEGVAKGDDWDGMGRVSSRNKDHHEYRINLKNTDSVSFRFSRCLVHTSLVCIPYIY